MPLQGQRGAELRPSNGGGADLDARDEVRSAARMPFVRGGCCVMRLHGYAVLESTYLEVQWE